MATPPSYEQRLQSLRILWAAMFASTLFYPAVPFLIERGEPPPDAVLLIGLAGAAVASAMASVVVPGILRASALARADLATREAPGQVAGAGNPFLGEAPRRAFVDPRAAMTAAFTSYQVAFLVGCALSETPALIGIVVASLGYSPLLAIPFCVASAALIAVRFPTLERVLAHVERRTGAKLPR
ncbi:MAG: hypothetical protein IT376_19940 [Polyangiaceae bacterium]|nr:hypothetical protein [Polyangiaceae bacterium]